MVRFVMSFVLAVYAEFAFVQEYVGPACVPASVVTMDPFEPPKQVTSVGASVIVNERIVQAEPAP